MPQEIRSRACIPTLPSDSGCEKGIVPLAMKVVATGMRRRSAKSTRASAAPARTTPLPARMIGAWALEISRPACSTFAGGGAGGVALWTLSGDLASSSAPATFSGRARKLAPGFSASATLNALRTTSGMISGARISVLYFEIGSKRFTRSRIWWLSLCIRVVAPCPAMATTGARSMLASATPVTRLVAPGPRVARHTPARPVRRPYTSAMNAAPCSWRVTTNWIELSSSASMTSMFSSPGMPKRYSTPSFSRHWTNSFAAFIAGSPEAVF